MVKNIGAMKSNILELRGQKYRSYEVKNIGATRSNI